MRSRILALLLALLLLPTSLPTSLLLAQTSDAGQPSPARLDAQDWQSLRDLKPGKKIIVEFKANMGEPVEGKFVSATGSKLTLTTDGYTRSLQQRDIQSVYRLKGRWSREKAASVGAGLGLLAGAAIGDALVVFQKKDVISAGYYGAFLGIFGGMGLGALLGGKRKGQLLYEAK